MTRKSPLPSAFQIGAADEADLSSACGSRTQRVGQIADGAGQAEDGRRPGLRGKQGVTVTTQGLV